MSKQLRFRLTVPAPAPIGGLLDPRFQYVPAAKTDLRATFARIRAEQQQPKGKP
ncbi:hypothetical protein [Variovorax saccharolyticus]|uniref:hypothetical protein n=1 Tax=Variovorax saccharolyticus TaxID=3053516 RepID=UPI0025752D44|nr:hypothetical protein [Variovorax sp. J31P216]MDM0024112.1 hypothetical protein [Variovorax sp. J31P216]